ncbi:MAG: hypothetical protein ACI87O_002854, partial [Planctomycetota bacterium]
SHAYQPTQSTLAKDSAGLTLTGISFIGALSAL